MPEGERVRDREENRQAENHKTALTLHARSLCILEVQQLVGR